MSRCIPCGNNNNILYTECVSVSIPGTDLGCITTPSSDCVKINTDYPCIGITSGMSLTDGLTSINDAMCGISGGVDNSQITCLYTAVNNLTLSIEEYVDGISEVFCNNVTNVDSILNPTVSGCTYLGINGLTTYQTLIQAYASKLCNLNARLDISTVDWAQCFSVSSVPTTIPQAFDLMVDQICAVKAIASTGSSTDQYVKISSSDSTPGYLVDKLVTNTPCITVTKINPGANEQLRLGLSFTPRVYDFDTSKFDINLMSAGCQNTYSVTLKSDAISFNCSTVTSLFLADTNLIPEGILAKSGDGCILATACDMRSMLFADNNPGDYLIRVVSDSDNCNKVVLVPSTTSPGLCPTTWNSLATTMSSGGSGSLFTWTATPGGTDSSTAAVLSTTNPQYRWTKDGNLEFKGAISVSTNNTISAAQAYSFDVILGNVSTTCAASPFISQEHFVMFKNISEGDLGTVGNIAAVLYVNESGQIGVKVKVGHHSSTHNQSIVIPLSGIRFNY